MAQIIWKHILDFQRGWCVPLKQIIFNSILLTFVHNKSKIGKRYLYHKKLYEALLSIIY